MAALNIEYIEQEIQKVRKELDTLRFLFAANRLEKTRKRIFCNFMKHFDRMAELYQIRKGATA